MWFGEPHPSPESFPATLSTLGQARYKGDRVDFAAERLSLNNLRIYN